MSDFLQTPFPITSYRKEGLWHVWKIGRQLRAKKDKKTFTLAVVGIVAFGVAVGAVAVYEKIIGELESNSGIAECLQPEADIIDTTKNMTINF